MAAPLHLGDFFWAPPDKGRRGVKNIWYVYHTSVMINMAMVLCCRVETAGLTCDTDYSMCNRCAASPRTRVQSDSARWGCLNQPSSNHTATVSFISDDLSWSMYDVVHWASELNITPLCWQSWQSIAKWGNTLVLETVAQWWNPFILQYYECYELGVGGDSVG